MYCENRFFTEAVFYEFGDRVLPFFGGPFSDFMDLENKVENRGIFDDLTDPDFWIWRAGSTGYLDFINS